MILNLFILSVSLFLIIKGAMLATTYAIRLSKNFRLSKYVIGLIVVAIISILPETLVSINAALAGMPEFGLGTLFGSNVADLTLVFTVIIVLTGKNIKIEKKILKNNSIYPFIFFIPILMGLNGHYSRIEGLLLLITGTIFYYFELKNGLNNTPEIEKIPGDRLKNTILLILSMALLLIGAHFVVDSAANIASGIGVSPVLIGMLIVGIGTTIPELLFSYHAVKKRDTSLAVGDILGTVLADATIVLGILALIRPFSFPITIIYVSGVYMLCASFMLAYFLRTGKTLSKKEGFFLFLFWLAFAISEYLING